VSTHETRRAFDCSENDRLFGASGRKPVSPKALNARPDFSKLGPGALLVKLRETTRYMNELEQALRTKALFDPAYKIRFEMVEEYAVTLEEFIRRIEAKMAKQQEANKGDSQIRQ